MIFVFCTAIFHMYYIHMRNHAHNYTCLCMCCVSVLRLFVCVCVCVCMRMADVRVYACVGVLLYIAFFVCIKI